MKRLLLVCVLVACSANVQRPVAPGGPVPVSTRPEPAAAAPSRVVTEHFHSDALGVDKAVVIYLPRGYDSQPARRWPVFYYLHGLGGNETNWVKRGKLDAAADQLGLAAIVVMPDGDDGFYIDSRAPIDHDQCMKDGSGLFVPGREPHDAACVHARNYETYIAKDLVGWVDGHYHTIARRDGRAVAGLSMGGFGAMELALRHPGEFAAAGSHSGAIALLYLGPRPFAPGKAELLTDASSFGREGGPIVAWIHTLFGDDIADWKAHDVVELAGKLGPGKVALYFDCGTEDDFALQDNVQYVHEALGARHIEHAFFVGPGKHDFAFWSVRVASSLAFLRDHTAKPEQPAPRGDLPVAIGRAADFFGPGCTNPIFGERFWTKLLAGRPVELLGDPDQPHTYSYGPDVADALVTLGVADPALSSGADVYGRVWHLPAHPAESTQAHLARFARAAGVEPRFTRLSPLLLRIAGLFLPEAGELPEMIYQWRAPFVLDDAQFRARFGATPTPVARAVEATVAWARARYTVRAAA